MTVMIVVFPGTNREIDALNAFKINKHKKTKLVWHKETSFPEKPSVIMIPGGFSYGDYLRAGAMAAQSPVMAAVIAEAKRGTPILGVCNGFQILCEANLLPGALLRNMNQRFISKWQDIEIINNANIFLQNYKQNQVVNWPIAHHDGRWIGDEKTVSKLEDQDRIALKYHKNNPNGSIANIAGILSENKRILGCMPHPENAIEEICGSNDGLELFSSLVA